MPASTRSGAGALTAALVLLLATLLGVESASAQVSAQTLRSAAPVSVYAAADGERSGTAEEDCKSRHGVRRSASVWTDGTAPARVCDCDVRTVPVADLAVPGTVRERVRSARPVDVQVLHQTFRC
ncbi:hypothetical protein K378_05918 [Streptomyces sp. Amel2xB2]|uniref:hypothetical protein n=1 Tax=Streptomyces sp. Amel2xB2 TaxID=1305829 RepID=UPI000DBA14B4|nr:hypothetical protein [Streptomyces sp. Amel2xB2]RAJ55428.1 hypothetical protein K378_05918 [Streptomyces sp. Amel2xB2]